jgi:hypothetical protein
VRRQEGCCDAFLSSENKLDFPFIPRQLWLASCQSQTSTATSGCLLRAYNTEWAAERTASALRATGEDANSRPLT